MSYDWAGDEILLEREPAVCFGGIHFSFRFMFDYDHTVFGAGAYESLHSTALIDSVHGRVVFRHLTRKDNGTYLEFFPFIIVTETSLLPTIPEPWDPDRGRRGHFKFEPSKTAIYRTDQPGSGPGSGVFTLYLLDAVKYKGTEESFPLVVGKNSANQPFSVSKVTVLASNPSEPITMRVGDRRPVPMSVQVGPASGAGRVFPDPFALSFQSREEFNANRETQWSQLSLKNVRKAFKNRWEKDRHGRLPFDLILTHASNVAGSDAPFRFYTFEDGEPGTQLQRIFRAVDGENSHPQRLIIRGRRAGSGEVTIWATNITTPERFDGDFINAGSVPVNVEPAALTLTAGPDPDAESLADGTIILEDFWDGEALRGSFAFSLRAPMPNAGPGAPAVSGQWLQYDSMQDALLVGQVSADSLVVEEIYVTEEANVWENGEKVLRSFVIELSIRDPDIIMFELPPEATVLASGRFEYFGPLKHILRAVGPGETEVSIEIKAPPEPIPEELVVYDMPAVRYLTVKVPDPLVAEFGKWQDDWFSDAPGKGTKINLADPPVSPPELIYNSGVLSGRARNHNPSSDSETIELLIDRPGQSTQTIDLLEYGVVNDDGGFSFDVTELRRFGNDGDNVLTIRAGKPINYVVDGHADEDSRTLRGVLPVIDTPAAFATPSPVLRRDIGATSYTYSRAISARLSDEVESSETGLVTREDVSDVQGVAYDPKIVPVANVRLPAIPGAHHVGVFASNEFGDTIDPGVFFEAPRPIATTNSRDWSIENNYDGGLFSGGTPSNGQTWLRAGFSADAALADVTVRYALTVSRRDSGVSRTVADAYANTPAGYDPFAERDFNMRVPRTGTLVADQWTETRVDVANEFANGSLRLRVHRRGSYFFWKDAVATLNLVENTLRMDVTVELPDGTSQFFPNQGDFFEIPFDDGRSQTGLRYERIQWAIFEIQTDEDGNPTRVAAESDIDLSDAGVAEGPDYELRVPLYQLSDDQVELGVPTTEWTGVPSDDPNVAFYNPARVKSFVDNIPVVLTFIRFVDSPFESL